MTFKLGVISDVHGDLGALQPALAQMDDLGVDLVVCAGDIVDGGDEPGEVVALLSARGVVCIQGNHDRWGLARHERGESEHDGDARKLYLQPETMRWLGALPTRWNRTIEGVRVAVRHGTPNSDMDGIYPGVTGSELERMLERVEADVLIVGHTHIPLVKHVSGGRLVVNPGALWRGAEASAATMQNDLGAGPARTAERVQGGCYGVLELPAKRWTLHRLPDIELP